MTDINDTLSQRGKTHGKYEDHARYTQEIKDIIRGSVSYPRLSQDQRETLEMIAHKLGRILAGNPDFFDHWHDIAGYATLSAKLCSDAPKEEKKDQRRPLRMKWKLINNTMDQFAVHDEDTGVTGYWTTRENAENILAKIQSRQEAAFGND